MRETTIFSDGMSRNEHEAVEWQLFRERRLSCRSFHRWRALRAQRGYQWRHCPIIIIIVTISSSSSSVIFVIRYLELTESNSTLAAIGAIVVVIIIMSLAVESATLPATIVKSHSSLSDFPCCFKDLKQHSFQRRLLRTTTRTSDLLQTCISFYLCF